MLLSSHKLEELSSLFVFNDSGQTILIFYRSNQIRKVQLANHISYYFNDTNTDTSVEPLCLKKAKWLYFHSIILMHETQTSLFCSGIGAIIARSLPITSNNFYQIETFQCCSLSHCVQRCTENTVLPATMLHILLNIDDLNEY